MKILESLSSVELKNAPHYQLLLLLALTLLSGCADSDGQPAPKLMAPSRTWCHNYQDYFYKSLDGDTWVFVDQEDVPVTGRVVEVTLEGLTREEAVTACTRDQVVPSSITPVR